MNKTVHQLVLLLASVCLSQAVLPDDPNYTPIFSEQRQSYGEPQQPLQAAPTRREYQRESREEDNYQPPQYSFMYMVKDEPSAISMDHGETRDQDNTKGEYTVALPDGRTQRVSYYVNGDSGFVAEVSYE